MPYNPGSAYPRKTIYVPPTYGEHSFRGAVNAPDFTSKGGFGQRVMPVGGRGIFAKSVGEEARLASGVAGGLSGMAATQRQGVIGNQAAKYMEQKGLKQNQRSSGGAAGAGAPNTPGEPMTRAQSAAASAAAGMLPKGDFDMGSISPDPSHRGPMQTGNTSAVQQRASASELADEMTSKVLDGTMPGDTGRANIKTKK